jgi:hypothetical protein
MVRAPEIVLGGDTVGSAIDKTVLVVLRGSAELTGARWDLKLPQVQETVKSPQRGQYTQFCMQCKSLFTNTSTSA